MRGKILVPLTSTVMISKKPDLEGYAFKIQTLIVSGIQVKSGFYHSWHLNLQFITDKLL